MTKSNGMSRTRAFCEARKRAKREQIARKSITATAGAVLFIGFFAVLGIVGGIENGANVGNAILTAPIFAIMIPAAKIIKRYFEN